MPEPLYVLPVRQPDADNLAHGKIRQIARNFPCDPRFAGCWVAIQATTGSNREQWSIVGVGKLAGACYYPGLVRAPQLVIGNSYRRDTGMAGAWGWTFTHMRPTTPIPLARCGEESGRYDPGLKRRVWEWTDKGDGGWWSCCPRELEQGMVSRVREARRKVKNG